MNGTRYQGWQRQATTDNTIQHILEWSIGKIWSDTESV